MKDESSKVRAAAAAALGRLWGGSPHSATEPIAGDPSKTVAALMTALEDDYTRHSAVFALTWMKAEEAVPRIIKLIREMPRDEPGRFHRSTCIRYLARVKDPRTSELLSEVLTDRQETLATRASAGKALVVLGQPAPGLGRIQRTLKLRNGPPAGIHSVCIDACQSYSAQRSDLGTDLRSSGTAIACTYTSEFDVCTPPGLHQFVARGGRAPLELASTGEEAAAYFTDVGIGGAARFGKSSWFGRWAFGLGLGVLDFESTQPSTVGIGYWGRAGLGVHLGPSAAIELFGDAHGWLGFDSDHFRSVGLSSAGLAVAFLF